MTVDVNKHQPQSSSGADAQVSRAANVLQNTYKLLAATLGTTAVAAFLSQLIGTPRIPVLVLLVGFYGLFYLIHRNRNSASGLWYTFALSAFMGFSLGPILATVVGVEGGSGLVANAFFLTALAFFSLSAYALRTKRDLKFLEGFLFAGFIVLVAAMLLSFFTSIPGLSMAISVGFVLFSSAAILYETNQIVKGGEDNYIMAAVGLYVSIYNLFLSLLSLLGMGSKE